MASLGGDGPGDPGLHRCTGDPDLLVAFTDLGQAISSVVNGRYEEAERHAARLVHDTGTAGEQWRHSYGLCVRGLALALGGDPVGGLERLREGLRIK
ncbi:hypothetical protein ACFQ07_28635, partial [Actinomadura adrarensis]